MLWTDNFNFGFGIRVLNTRIIILVAMNFLSLFDEILLCKVHIPPCGQWLPNIYKYNRAIFQLSFLRLNGGLH